MSTQAAEAILAQLAAAQAEADDILRRLILAGKIDSKQGARLVLHMQKRQRRHERSTASLGRLDSKWRGPRRSAR